MSALRLICLLLSALTALTSLTAWTAAPAAAAPQLARIALPDGARVVAVNADSDGLGAVIALQKANEVSVARVDSGTGKLAASTWVKAPRGSLPPLVALASDGALWWASVEPADRPERVEISTVVDGVLTTTTLRCSEFDPAPKPTPGADPDCDLLLRTIEVDTAGLWLAGAWGVHSNQAAYEPWCARIERGAGAEPKLAWRARISGLRDAPFGAFESAGTHIAAVAAGPTAGRDAANSALLLGFARPDVDAAAPEVDTAWAAPISRLPGSGDRARPLGPIARHTMASAPQALSMRGARLGWLRPIPAPSGEALAYSELPAAPGPAAAAASRELLRAEHSFTHVALGAGATQPALWWLAATRHARDFTLYYGQFDPDAASDLLGPVPPPDTLPLPAQATLTHLVPAAAPGTAWLAGAAQSSALPAPAAPLKAWLIRVTGL